MKPLYLALLGLTLHGQAQAQDVYPGCEVPTSVANRKVHFVDPVKGSNTGDGTAQKPWKSLAFILNPANKIIATNGRKAGVETPLLPMNTAGALKGGDTVMLMSGNYGDVTLQNVFNDKFITVMAAPGQTPVISHLRVTGGSRWLFQGITFEYANPSAPKGKVVPSFVNLTQVYDGWQGSSSNIIFDSSTFRSTTDVSGWSDEDWFTRPEFYSLSIKSPCVAVTNSIFRNVQNAIALWAKQALVKNNVIDHFSNDGIDLVTGDVTIYGNTIENGTMTKLSQFHPDGIQGWSQTVNGKEQENANVVIDSNKVYNYSLNSDNWLQAIDMFRGVWNNLLVQNNSVVTNHYHGITVWGAKNSKIINNTVMPSNPSVYPTWISVKPSPNGPSQNVLVRNNVAYQIHALDKAITFDHNATVIGFYTLSGEKLVYHSGSDTASKNLVLPNAMATFQGLDPSKLQYDARLKSTSSLIGAGMATAAPTLDILGRRRASPTDIGAYMR